ncbi:MAG: ECF-type sigma factor [Dokdonella sp.]|jgi:RNA polymerase sigma factor (TIGR02999 family)|nr:ECF-type sigma factor [Dokdonella sp.]
MRPALPAGSDPGEITVLLGRWQAGDRVALDALLPRVYAELRAMAAGSLAGQAQVTLQPTALVNDVLMRLLEAQDLQFQSHRDLFKVAGRIMRNLLIDHARHTRAEKRGGGLERVDLIEAMQLPIPRDTDLEKLDAALGELEAVDPRLARTVELRYFVGLSVRELAGVMGVDERTVYRDFALARLWLRDQLDD